MTKIQHLVKALLIQIDLMKLSLLHNKTHIVLRKLLPDLKKIFHFQLGTEKSVILGTKHFLSETKRRPTSGRPLRQTKAAGKGVEQEVKYPGGTPL